MTKIECFSRNENFEIILNQHIIAYFASCVPLFVQVRFCKGWRKGEIRPWDVALAVWAPGVGGFRPLVSFSPEEIP